MPASSINKIQEYLKDARLDAFLILTRLNRQYVSGFTGSMGAVLVTKRGAELFVDDRYTIRARKESDLRVRPAGSLTLSGRIGVEDNITVREFAKLKKYHRRANLVTCDNVVENLRAVKSTQELRHITKAQSSIDKIFLTIRKMSLVGMSEIELSQKMERLAIKYGADRMAFESIVAFGQNAAAPHHLSGKQKIKRGNFLLLDFGVLINAYHSDFTRTLFVGNPTKKQERVYNIVLEAQRRGIEKVIADNRAVLVDEAARGYIKRTGFGKKFTHNTGHGVGLEIHELPNFSTKTGDILQKNMVVTVEPGIYIENWGGVRIEDMVLVTATAPVVLSKSPKDLESMIIK